MKKTQEEKINYQSPMKTVLILICLTIVLTGALTLLTIWMQFAIVVINSHQLTILYEYQWLFWTGLVLTIIAIVLTVMSSYWLKIFFKNYAKKQKVVIKTMVILNLVFATLIVLIYVTLLVVAIILFIYNNANGLSLFNPLLIGVLWFTSAIIGITTSITWAIASVTQAKI